ncbi:MAG: OmcA/MtrC family decaheme c-type cytochrome [Chromatiales bacterium]
MSENTRGGAFRRLFITFVLALFGLALAGCDDGDDGRDGADGMDGATGLSCWDLNENGIKDFPDEDTNGDGVIDVNDCRGEDAVAGDLSDPGNVEKLAEEGEPIETVITDVTIASAPVVTMTVTDADGNPLTNLGDAADVSCAIAKLIPAANGFPSMYESYTNTVETDQDFPNSDSPNLLARARQAARDSGELVDLGGGEYTFTFDTDVADVTEPFAVEYDSSLTHKVGCEIRFAGIDGSDVNTEELNPDNPTYLFVPDGGDPSSKEIAATENCNSCHDRFAIHGDGRFTYDYCQNCHNPYTRDQDYAESLDLSHMIHSIHAAEVRAGQEDVDGEYSYKVLGYGERFSGDAATDDFSHVTYPQAVNRCENCHNTETEGATEAGDWLVSATTTVCGGCHVSGIVASAPDADSGLSTYSFQHPPEAAGGAVVPDGACTNCHGTNGFVATDEVHLKGSVLSEKLGEDFVFEILSAENVEPGDTPTITIRVTDADGNPYDLVNDPEFTEDAASLNLYVAWTTDDIYNGDEAGLLLGERSDGRAVQDGTLNPGYPLRMRIAEIQAAVGAPNADGSYDVPYFTALPLDWTGDVMIALGGHPAGNAGTDAAPDYQRAYAKSAVFYPGTPRAEIVKAENCQNCHGYLAFHGGNRNGDTQICLVCHNADLADGVDVDDDEVPDFNEGFGFGYMIHSIHVASDTYYGGGFAEVTYPQSIANCGACHEEGTYNAARATARAISTDQGADRARWDDDTATTASSAQCGTCHSSNAAAGHFATNGGFIDVTKDPGLLGNPPVGQEACAVCHGAGSTFDTTLYHGD